VTLKEKSDLIAGFINLSHAFDDTLDLEDEVLHYRPFDDAWSIVEQIIHCVDFDIANFHRYRWGIVSPGTTVLSFDGSWTQLLKYQSSDLGSAISLIDSDWSTYQYCFSTGKSFNLEEALPHFITHVGFHRELIDRNIRLCAETRP
jgi:hypothetical protein